VAGGAVAWRAIEHRIDVAGLAGQVAVRAVELEAGGRVVEPERDRWLRRGGRGQRRQAQQGQH
jgi:hypothetical protein